MNRAGEQLLTGTRLSFNKHGNRPRRHESSSGDNPPHDLASVDDARELGRLRRKASAQTFEGLVGTAEQVWNEVGRDIERYRGRPDTMLAR